MNGVKTDELKQWRDGMRRLQDEVASGDPLLVTAGVVAVADLLATLMDRELTYREAARAERAEEAERAKRVQDRVWSRSPGAAS